MRRALLDLADALAAHAQRRADLAEGLRHASLQPIAAGDDLTLPGGQAGQRLIELSPQQPQQRGLVGGGAPGVLEQVAQHAGVFVRGKRRVEGKRRAGDGGDGGYRRGAGAQRPGKLGVTGLAAQLVNQLLIAAGGTAHHLPGVAESAP